MIFFGIPLLLPEFLAKEMRISAFVRNVTRYQLSTVLLILFVMYIVQMVIFAGILLGLNLGSRTYNIEPTTGLLGAICVESAGPTNGRFPEFEDMVLLSWTTFSTVGYGNIYPRADIDDPVLYPWCAAFNVVLILEAFSGIVYSSLAAGIVINILQRSNAEAAVVWSSVGVLRMRDRHRITQVYRGRVNFNVGEIPESLLEDAQEEPERASAQAPHRISHLPEGLRPPEILRMNGMRHISYTKRSRCERRTTVGSDDTSILEQGGDALPSFALSNFSNVSDSDSDSDEDSVGVSFSGSKAQEPPSLRHERLHVPPILEFRFANARYNQYMRRRALWSRLTALLNRILPRCLQLANKNHEGPRPGTIVGASLSASVGMRENGQLRYYPLKLEMSEHPMFEKTWYVRHKLDEHSPIVRRKTRKMIKMNAGKLPEYMLASSQTDGSGLAQHVRKFQRILINMEGKELDSGSDVCSVRAYTMSSLRYGFVFDSITTTAPPVDGGADPDDSLDTIDVDKLDSTMYVDRRRGMGKEAHSQEMGSIKRAKSKVKLLRKLDQFGRSVAARPAWSGGEGGEGNGGGGVGARAAAEKPTQGAKKEEREVAGEAMRTISTMRSVMRDVKDLKRSSRTSVARACGVALVSAEEGQREGGAGATKVASILRTTPPRRASGVQGEQDAKWTGRTGEP